MTQTCNGNFKIKPYLKDDYIDQCFNCASIILDCRSLNQYVDPD